jgi:putative membrane protein
MARSAWFVLPLIALIALAGCAVAPQPMAPAPPAAPPTEAAPPPGPPTASSDQEFINVALGMGRSEIGMGRLALGKAAAHEVRAFAEQMVAAHTAANQRLEALAKRLKIEASPVPDQPPPELIAASGADFDKRYVAIVVKAHRDMIALFESEDQSGQDPRAKHFARSTLPELRHHLRMAEMLAQKLGL